MVWCNATEMPHNRDATQQRCTATEMQRNRDASQQRCSATEMHRNGTSVNPESGLLPQIFHVSRPTTFSVFHRAHINKPKSLHEESKIKVSCRTYALTLSPLTSLCCNITFIFYKVNMNIDSFGLYIESKTISDRFMVIPSAFTWQRKLTFWHVIGLESMPEKQ